MYRIRLITSIGRTGWRVFDTLEELEEYKKSNKGFRFEIWIVE